MIRIQRELDITFIMVTHSQQEAMALADKVIVMSDALVQQIGSSREIAEAPRTKFVADFIGNNTCSAASSNRKADRSSSSSRTTSSITSACRNTSAASRLAKKPTFRFAPI